ncbi:uncharacterized protein LOC130832471 isoform X2 [Hippopotamus amphibius kiboko]|uniref:uncharacterized protein LOC130832471 isoform X2 n=1 Tax=Hippopotamus amphibius kiboko TaxID=575201 RepID=UPI0025987F3C|nr:uncharacterized protein LOC130832471 isoform X2 [Hippopotamus amphibius kiboko]XP_057556762.1 uncharacterized protein LOC130832471 isoform X2 [Hippopotamus amphibius kiboko]
MIPPGVHTQYVRRPALESYLPFFQRAHSEMLAVCNPERGLHPTMLAPPSRTVENKYLLPWKGGVLTTGSWIAREVPHQMRRDHICVLHILHNLLMSTNKEPFKGKRKATH